MNKLIIAAGMALLCAGCAVVGGGRPSAEDGQKVWSVWGSTEDWAFNNADELCPYGYYVLDERANRPLPPMHIMEIRCKPESSGQVDVVTRFPEPKPYNPEGIGEVGQYSYIVERMSEVRACNETPMAMALIEAKGPGVEMYTLECTDGGSMRVRCEFSNCAVVR